MHDRPPSRASAAAMPPLVSRVHSMIPEGIAAYVGRTFPSANGKPRGILRGGSADPA